MQQKHQSSWCAGDFIWSPAYFQSDNKFRLAVMYQTGNMMLWMAVSAEIHPVHNDEALWIQHFVMHIICRGGDLLESWVTVKQLLLCSTDVVGTQFTFPYFPSFQSICASLRSYTNQTKPMPEFIPTTTELSFLEFSEETGDIWLQNIFSRILGDQLKSFKDQTFWQISLETLIFLLSFSGIFKTVPFIASVILQIRKNYEAVSSQMMSF